MRRIFLDTNVLIDVILKRDDYVSAAKVMALFVDSRYKLYVSVLTMANIVYILRKEWKGDRLYDMLAHLSDILTVCSITDSDYNQALMLRAKDFEDALQYSSALSAQCDVIVTRNTKDFYFSKLMVYTPAQFLASL